MTKSSRWALSVCAGMSFALGCFELRPEPDTGPRPDAVGPDVYMPPPVLPERCNLAWLRTIPVNPVGLGLVRSIAVDGDDNVLVAFGNANEFMLEGVRYPGGDYLMGLDRENRLQVRPSERVVTLASTEGRIVGAATDSSGMTRLLELDGSTGETLHDFGAFRAEEFSGAEAAFVGNTLVWSMRVGGAFAFPGAAMRVLPRGTSIVLAIRPDAWIGVAEFDTPVPMTRDRYGALLMGAPGPLCFDGICQDVPAVRRRIHEDGSITDVHRAAVDTDPFAPAEIRALSEGSLVTYSGPLSRWDSDGALVWYQWPAFFSSVEQVDVAERADRVVTMAHIEAFPTGMLGGFRLDLGASTQDVFVEFSLAGGTPRRWWHIENPDAGGRSGAHSFAMGASGRSYAAGIADPVVDVCGMRAMEGLFVAAFD